MGGVSREAEMSMAALSMFPGFRFSPKDEELIQFYLKKKLEGSDESVDVISEIEICKFEPWDLPGKSRIGSENEWFFFCPRGRKYPNGTQNKRATEMGYWKATGKERNVKSGSEIIGTKRTLVFHLGRAPTGQRTDWIMHEYCFINNSQLLPSSCNNSMVVCRLRKNNDFTRTTNKRQLDLDDGGEKVAEAAPETDRQYSKNCSSSTTTSSFDSHSLDDQFDSVSASAINNQESNHTHLQTSELELVHLHDQKGGNGIGDEDQLLYADLLKDDIIALDDSLLSTTSQKIKNSSPTTNTIIMNFPESEKRHTQSPPEEVEEAPPCHEGNATRRIKLKKPNPNHIQIDIALLIFLLIIIVTFLHNIV